MARGNLLLGKAKGRLGSVVFAQTNGEQITRSKPESVKNPKSTGQNTQRAILATIAKAAAAMTSLVDHSFAGIKYGADSVRYFRKINLGIIRKMYLNTQNSVNLVAKGGIFVPNPLKISGGSLPAFYANVVSADKTIAFYQSEKVLPKDQDITVSDFLAVYPNIQGGDQLTLVKIRKVTGSLQDGDGIFNMSLDRMVFAPNAFDDLGATIITSASGVIDSSFLDMTKTTKAEMLNLADGGPGTGLGFTDENCYYAALILSRKVNNQWQRSTQFLEMMNYDDSANNAAAIASYGATESINAQTEYLNQAEEGNEVSGIRGAYMNVTTKMTGADPNTDTIGAGETGSSSYEGASGTIVDISAQAYAQTGKRVVTVEIDRPDGSFAAHGARSINYTVGITAQTAGNWKVVALYDDGSRAEYTVTLAVQA